MKTSKKIINQNWNEGQVLEIIEDWEEEYRPLPAKEFVAMTKQRKLGPHIVEGILPDEPGEYALLAGRPGLGKTNLALHLAHCISTGQDFLGFKCQKSTVVYIGFEGGRANLAERLEKIMKEFPDEGEEFAVTMLPIEKPSVLFDKVFKLTQGYKVVIIDPVKFIVEGEYITARDASPFMQKLKAALAENGSVAILISHIRKPANRDSLIQTQDVYNVRGATEYVDSASSVLVMEKKSYDRRGVIELGFAKRKEAVEEALPLTLMFDSQRCLFRQEVEVSSDGKRIKAYLAEGE